MIDFSDANDEQLFMEFQNFKKLLISIFIYFLQGRSFHACMLMLCYPKRNGENFWESYYYLIIGKKNNIVDSRWIGHSIKQEFSSL